MPNRESSEPHRPDQYLKDAYLGELTGEATLQMLRGHFPEKVDALNQMARIEALTAKFLRAHLCASVSLKEEAQARAQGRSRKDPVDYADWSDFIHQIVPLLKRAVLKSQGAEALAPTHLKSVYEIYTAHEQALIDFLELEKLGLSGHPAAESYFKRLP